MMLRSSFSDLLGLTYPIMNAPMAGPAGGELAAAVANAGGLGMIGGSGSGPGLPSPEWIRREVALARSLTARPFGVGFISTQRVPGSSHRTVEELQAIALDEGVTIIGHSFMVPAHLIAEARRRGARVISQVQTLAMAKEAVAAGADVLVAQGFDGGGHVGSIGTMSIVPAVVDVAGSRPVLAAGGIADGRGLAAALMLGAQGANIGTRFFASAEAIIPDFARERLVGAGTDDTVWTRTYDLIRDADFGPTVALRLLRTTFTDIWEGRPSEAKANSDRLIAEIDEAWERGSPTARVLAGSAVGLVRDVEPAGAIVRGICAEAEQIIRSRSATLLV
jgi:nitronate monooxygenase